MRYVYQITYESILKDGELEEEKIINLTLIVPFQIILGILSHLPTLQLLPLSRTSHHLHSLVTSEIRLRLYGAAALTAGQFRVILECYHPAAKFSTPQWYCQYIGTDVVRDSTSAKAFDGTDDQYGRIGDYYSRFRPLTRTNKYVLDDSVSSYNEDHEGGPFIFPAPFTPYPGWSLADGSGASPRQKQCACSSAVTLDGQEDLVQLCTSAFLVKGRKKNSDLRASAVLGKGVVRLWRQWLQETAVEHAGQKQEAKKPDIPTSKERLVAARNTDSGDVLHVGPADDIALKINVAGKPPPAASSSRVSDLAEYNVEYAGKLFGLCFYIRENSL
jgi:hypothetical protein